MSPRSLLTTSCYPGYQNPQGLSSSPAVLSQTEETRSEAFDTRRNAHVNSKISGVGLSVPRQRISNENLEKVVETSDEWIASRTGIKNRHVLDSTASLSVLAQDAAVKAVESSSVDAATIDLVLLASSTPEDLFGDATSVASRIGAKNAVAFDITAACSGFLFAMATANQYIQAGAFKKAVIVGADALSKWVDWSDRNTCILFGDGAGAIVMEADESNQTRPRQQDIEGHEKPRGVLGMSLHSDGKRREQLTLSADISSQVLPPGVPLEVTKSRYGNIYMNGREVFKFATREVPQVIREALGKAELTVDDVDHFVLHQANIRILDAVAERLQIPRRKLLANLDKYGNTSAASIPLMLAEAVTAGTIRPGDIVVMAGFGAGLSWGAMVLRW